MMFIVKNELSFLIAAKVLKKWFFKKRGLMMAYIKSKLVALLTCSVLLCLTVLCEINIQYIVIIQKKIFVFLIFVDYEKNLICLKINLLSFYPAAAGGR